MADSTHSYNNAQNSYTSAHPPSVASSSSLGDEKNASRQSSAGNSVAPSPLGSRDPSPIRPQRPSAPTRPSYTRSRPRKNGVIETSPTRLSRSGVSQPQGTSRILSAINTPPLHPGAQDSNPRGSAPQKSTASTDQARNTAPRWPVSPRLRSPPPQLNRPSISHVQSRRGDQDSANAGAVRAAGASPTPPDLTPMSESESEEIQLQSGLRTPAHGSTLETVQEVSLPNSPKFVTDAAMEQVKEKLASELATQSEGGYAADVKTLRARPGFYLAESGSESGSMKVEGRKAPAGVPAPPPPMSRQSSSMSTMASKTKPDGSTQNMTVETETVVSVPNVALAPAGQQGGSGTLKTRPSAETIKPKKEKRKSTRKQAVVPSGAASSKAEIFEAKVASAVDEADDSDSEETFVYDSNPPEGPRRFHSRTPSATSMMSQADRSAMRSIHSVIESAGPPMTTRKNMKFANTLNNGGSEPYTPEDDNKGTGRSNAGSGRGTGRHHHHVGRWGRGSHTSLFDNESPFPSASRPKFSTANSRQSSQPPSPRNQFPRGGPSSKRPTIPMSNSYDLDDTTGADDERTPLMFAGSGARSYRSTRSRRGTLSHRQLEAQSYRSGPSYLNRLAACLVVTMMVLLVVTGAISFMFATSQPLTNIELTDIHNVIASEPELMFDLTVQAHNPNIVVIAIDNANLEIFAKSIHAGSDSEWWKYPNGPPEGDDSTRGDGETDVHISDDPPTDMPDDDAAPNMRLGTITEFDSPLTFEGSFFHKGKSASTGGMRLQLPGNQTAGGSERWGRILQDEFDLIIKGIVKYNLPLSQRVRTASISGRTTVKPNSANDPDLKPNSTRLALGG
ncbi:related to vacuolar protein VAC7 [Cephalotrichum gorgonifer]|uniref:Related to vacuolar protein VAC7 n=1 Tax=Cephalotrichum gorgonifer TaxID=2041049 RepID=A0AAE8MRR6_9PEZI|nr:related to vacuolar protein VAC7 [Cephalotrichum gorgonifer]